MLLRGGLLTSEGTAFLAHSSFAESSLVGPHPQLRAVGLAVSLPAPQALQAQVDTPALLQPPSRGDQGNGIRPHPSPVVSPTSPKHCTVPGTAKGKGWDSDSQTVHAGGRVAKCGHICLLSSSPGEQNSPEGTPAGAFCSGAQCLVLIPASPALLSLD